MRQTKTTYTYLSIYTYSRFKLYYIMAVFFILLLFLFMSPNFELFYCHFRFANETFSTVRIDVWNGLKKKRFWWIHLARISERFANEYVKLGFWFHWKNRSCIQSSILWALCNFYPKKKKNQTTTDMIPDCVIWVVRRSWVIIMREKLDHLMWMQSKRSTREFILLEHFESQTSSHNENNIQKRYTLLTNMLSKLYAIIFIFISIIFFDNHQSYN